MRDFTPQPPLTPALFDSLMNLLKTSFHGRITLVIQNFRLVQVERQENFSPDELLAPGGVQEFSRPALIKKINRALEHLEFGQVVIIFKKGRLSQIERIAKERVTDVSGLDGEGI
ncbi:MAG: YezD family protein [Candidatus Adiutrix sp.]|jgi:hypothetical protein|nr:YezD family protein [Candidatus Adiutrix sp.]